MNETIRKPDTYKENSNNISMLAVSMIKDWMKQYGKQCHTNRFIRMFQCHQSHCEMFKRNNTQNGIIQRDF